MAGDDVKFAFQDSTAPVHGHSNRRHRRAGRSKQKGDSRQRNQQSSDACDNDGTGSLTYSASSSINSGSSHAEESTDSSFADIMRVLDLDDSSELAALMTKEAVSNPDHHAVMQYRTAARRNPGRAASVTSSLNYSDGESSVSGGKEPSDTHGHDEEGLGSDIIFAPAMPDDGVRPSRKSKKSSKKTSSKSPASRPKTQRNDSFASAGQYKSSSRHSTPNSTRTAASTPTQDTRSSSGSGSMSTPTSPPPRAGPPKRRSTHRSGHSSEAIGENDRVWYAQWWMCGFTDALSNSLNKSC
eukprot:CAMPEP_0198283074 /NCGR_PEP_ID=MMETSP1449-20131203/2754_1 /TAXON_ID=420275 /ORGANISM="Attheya septentrionalis, Strain CCMP2084" /LENGTH=297 /DNA_ID=CAMNT_0043979551 /DNA_START=417 /DNA_END=1310 /DNA_ORIENTATION=+